MNKFLLTFLSPVFALIAPTTSAIEISKHLTTIIEPVPLKRINPEYPISAARAGKSGWAKLSFIIKEDGNVSDVVVNETSGVREFGKAAKKALRKWKYEPAMENGKAIQQCVNTIRMDFKMSGGGISKRFRNKYNQALEAFEQKDFQVLKEVLAELSKFDDGDILERNLYHTIAFQYAEIIEDKKLQFEHLRKIDVSSETKEAQKQKLAILNKRFYLSVSLNEFNYAYKTYKIIKTMEIAQPLLSKYETIIAKVDNFIGGDQNLVIQGDIEERDFWYYQLVRNEFSLTDINGSLNKIDVRCANKRHVYTAMNNNTWKLPKQWKNCSVFVYGDDNTKFKLVEHPLKS